MIDAALLIARVVHVGSAMISFRGAIIGRFSLRPTARALGPAGRPFMEHLLKRRALDTVFPVVAGLTVLGGAALYWRDSRGLQTASIASSG